MTCRGISEPVFLERRAPRWPADPLPEAPTLRPGERSRRKHEGPTPLRVSPSRCATSHDDRTRAPLRRLRLPARGRRGNEPRHAALPRLDRLAAFVSGGAPDRAAEPRCRDRANGEDSRGPLLRDAACSFLSRNDGLTETWIAGPTGRSWPVSESRRTDLNVRHRQHRRRPRKCSERR
jgi:hypothetical protein